MAYQQPARIGWGFSLAGFVASLLQPAVGLPAPSPDGGRRVRVLPLLSVGLSLVPAVQQLVPGVPNAYLRVLVYNADSVLVAWPTKQLTSAADASKAGRGYEQLSLRVLVPAAGYVQAYVANESDTDVFFDDISVEHRQGLQVQENHYDPFGLELAGLSRSATPQNKFSWNGKERQDEFELGWHDHGWRFYDPQLGRWVVTDPDGEEGDQEGWTSYQFGLDKAVRYNDLDGRQVGGPGGGFGSGLKDGYVGTFTGIRDWAVASVQSPGAFVGAVVDLAEGASPTGMLVGQAKQAYSLGKAAYGAAANGDTYSLGRELGGIGAQITIAVATEGAGRAVGAVRGAVRGARAAEGAGTRVPCGCFTAGTGVSTRLGRKPIEQIQVGDSVWAYNERTRQTALRLVTHLLRYERDTVYVLHTATGEALRTTSDHPFYVCGQWVRVKHLRVGDSLVSQSGQRHVLRRIELQPEHVTVYNFTVEELHTYFVGREAILVHNVSCPGTKTGGYSHPESQKPLQRAKGGRPQADPDATGPHTRLGKSKSSSNGHNQAAEFDNKGNPLKEIDFTDHGAPGSHTNPHQHRINPNEPQYHRARGKPEPPN